jgi:excisionase family DNA binding protein
MNSKSDVYTPKEILTAKDVMEWLEISRPTLYRLTKKGIITAYKLTGKLFFKRSEIMAVIEAGRIN